MPLILSIDKSENIKWYIDAVFLVHKYMMIHTGGFMTVVTDWDYVQSIQKKWTLIVQMRMILSEWTMSWPR